MKKFAVLLSVFCIVLTAFSAEKFKEKGFYLSHNLTIDKDFPLLEKIAERAEKAGYNTVYLGDWKFGQPWGISPRYVKQVQRVVNMLRRHRLRVMVFVTQLGDTCPYMNECPEEVETQPSRQTPFKVVKGMFTPQNILPNSSFEQGLKGWRLDPDANIRLDTTVSCSGKNSLHFQLTKKEDAPNDQFRVWLDDFPVRPYTQYTLSFMVKTKGMKGPNDSFGISAAPLGKTPDRLRESRYLCYRRITKDNPMKSTQEWREYRVIFNTLENSRLKLALGGWGVKAGEFWIDDVKLAPTSFMNVVRRTDLPVVITSKDGKTVYEEGRDCSPVRDPKCGNIRWKGNFNDTHAAPQIKVLPGSRIKEGDTVLVSYYHAAFSLKSVCICLNSPKLKPLITRQIEWFNKNIQPDGYIISIDEHRCYGYDPACERSGLNAGAKLEELACYTHDEVRRIAPKAAIYMWNDMFDPTANCKPGRFYYLVKGKGTLYGNWHKLPKDIIILLWTLGANQERNLQAMKHWRELGFKFVAFPGYFDAVQFNSVTRPVLKQLVKEPACIGIAFAHWSGIRNYRPHFEELLKAAAETEKRR